MKKIKQYKIIEKIGSGGMGEVYKAFDTILERYVAIKVMHRHLLEDSQNDERFMREARMVAKSTHTNIVTIFEIGKSKLERYIVMELVQGTSLNAMIKDNGALKTERAVKLAIQILSGLQHAHALNILHRDIKSENILVTKKGNIKILDFGIAKMASKEGLTIAGDLLGTVEYMAPEQLMGEPTDHRSDIYSAGVVLYQMLTATLPFVSDSPAGILYKLLNEDAIPPSHYNGKINKSLDFIVLKALNKIKDERWESAEEFSKSLEDWQRKQTAPGNLETGAEVSVDLDDENVEHLSQSVFIGREQEMKLLTNLFSKATIGKGQTSVIMGEAGVGKSTFAERFKKYIQLQNAFVLYGASLYQEGMDAYLPFIDALRTFFSNESHRLPENKRSEMKTIVREKTPLLVELTEKFTTHFGKRKDANNIESNGEYNLVEGIYSLISVLSTINPVVLIIDDLQWADESSLRLFHYLSRYIKNDRICLVGISRTDRYDLRQNGKPGMLLDMLARIRRDSNYTEIKIDRLDRESCDMLIDRLLSPNLFTEQFYKSIFLETKGNPLFVTETLKQLQETNCIYNKKDDWYNIQDGLEVIVPDRVEDIFVRRLSSLNSEEHEILQVAAVQGYKFDASVLSVILEIPKIKILKICQHIERELEIIASTERGFNFEHPLLKDLLYNEIPTALRREYHLMVAEELEKIHGNDLGTLVGDVALHFRNGGNHSKAIPLLFNAGLRAFGLSAFRESSIYFEDMLDSVKETGNPIPDEISQFDLYFKLGICYEEISRFEKSLETYTIYLKLSQEHNDAKNQANALLRLGRIQGKISEWDSALSNYEECLKIGKENSLENLLSRVYNNIGIIYFQKGNIQKALDCFEMTIKVVDSDYGEFDKAHALTNMGIISNINNDHRKAMKNYQKALKIYESRKDRQQDQARIHHNIGMTCSDLGEWQSAIRSFESCLKLADEVEDLQLVALTYLNMGKTYMRQNNFLKAKRLTEKALKIFKRTDDTINVAETFHVLGLIAEGEGNSTLAEKHLLYSIKLNEDVHYNEGLAESFVSLGHIYLHQGKNNLAVKSYDNALHEYETLNFESKTKEVAQILNNLEQYSENPIRVVELEEPKKSVKKPYASNIRHS